MTSNVMDKPDRRAELIADLRRLADWLEANPEVPVGPYPYVELAHYPDREGDGASFAEVDRIAALIGVEVEVSGREGHRSARKVLGRASYRAVAVPDRAMAEHEALQSYRGLVEPAGVR